MNAPVVGEIGRNSRETILQSILTSAVLSAGLLFGAVSIVTAAEPVERSGDTYYVAVCPRLVPDGMARCMAHVVTDSGGHILVSHVAPGGTPAGYGPADLQSAYNITTKGSSSTIIALVDGFGYPNAEADLAVYRAQYGLSPCTTKNGCFTKYNEKGGTDHFPVFNTGWAQETSLDLDMASAMCPNCKIILVEGNNGYLKHLSAAEDTAAALGAHVISNSYANGENRSAPYAASYNHPGVAITAATGDNGYGIAFPATSPYVIAVGGTHLVQSQTARGWTETVWGGAGSGCSKVYAKPTWQTDPGCSKRMAADVAAVADPNTGVAVYGPLSANSSGWFVLGGTSVATPVVGGVFANNGGPVNAASTLYANPGQLNDVTAGGNGPCPRKPDYFCNGEVGYDGPTGLGTPNGTTAF
jgi:subtilase family serine protease